MAVQRSTCRADAGVGDGVVGKVGGFTVCRFLIFSGFIVKWFGFVCVIESAHLKLGSRCRICFSAIEGVDTAVIEGE